MTKITNPLEFNENNLVLVMETPTKNRFAQTRGTWIVLLCAASAWLTTSVWAYRVAVSDGLTGSRSSDSPVINTAQSTKLIVGNDSQRLTVSDAAQEARLATERQAADEARLAAEQQAAEEARMAIEQEAAEEARMAVEQEAAAEEARRTAEQGAAKKARLAAEQEVAEEARLTAEQEAAEEARLAAEQEAAEEARLAAEQEAAEEARLAAEQEAAEEARLAAMQQNREAEQARQAASVEAQRVSEATTRSSAFEKLKSEELSVLPGLSARLRFQGRSEALSTDIERTLDQMFEPLFLYSEMSVLVEVTSNEFDDDADNARLSRTRAESIVDYLVSRGLEPDRFRIIAENGSQLRYGTHDVKVFAEDPVE